MNTLEYIKEAHEHQKGKVCTTCNIWKPFNKFNNNKNHKDKLRYECKSCVKKYSDNVCRFKRWYTNKKANAKLRGIEFTIEPTDIPGVKIREIKTYFKTVPSWEATKYPKVCFKWGIKLNWSMNGVSQYNSPSLDRIDPTKGYVKGNVRLVCNSYNTAKCNCPPNEWDVLEKTIARNILFENK